MNPISVALTAGALVVVGQWARNENMTGSGKSAAPTVGQAIGVAGIALGLSVLEQMNEGLSDAFATLILVSIAIVYLPHIVRATGLAKK